MKLEALNGFLRTSPSDTTNIVSLQGREDRWRRQQERKEKRADRKYAGKQSTPIARGKRVGRTAIQGNPTLKCPHIRNGIGNLSVSVDELEEIALDGLFSKGIKRAKGSPGGKRRQKRRTDRATKRAAAKKEREDIRQTRRKKRERRAGQTRAERRSERVQERRDERESRRDARREDREDRIRLRQESRTGRQQDRIDARLERQAQRQEARLERQGASGLRDLFTGVGEGISSFGDGDGFRPGIADAVGDYADPFLSELEDVTGFDVEETKEKLLGEEEEEGKKNKMLIPLAIGGGLVTLYLINKGKKGKKRKK